MISAIVAVNEDWGIGYNGELLENIPDDLKHFKKITSGSNVIMGLNTWMSLPKKPLPNRNNIIIDYVDNIYFKDEATFQNMETTIDLIKTFSHEQFFIIGGGSIYKQLLPYCEKVYITKIFKRHENVDTFFPNLDETNEWQVIEESEMYNYNGVDYKFYTYERRNLTL